jgi:hypothetical protein
MQRAKDTKVLHNARVCVFDGTYYKMMLIGVLVSLFCKISFLVKHLMPYYAERMGRKIINNPIK